MKYLLMMALVWSAFSVQIVQAQEPQAEQVFSTANTAYQNADYKGAIEGYASLLKRGFVSGDLYFNLGNSYYRMGELGRAMYYLRKAEELMPRDPDVKFNLDFARNKTSEKIDPKFSLGRTLYALFPLNLQEAWWCLLFVGVGLFITLVLQLYWMNDVVLWLKRGFLVLFLISLLAVFFRHFLREPYGVVVGAATSVYSGFGKDDVVLFALTPGIEFVTEQKNQDWTQVRLGDGKRGWLKNADIVSD